jgi:hypothetical protein
MTYDDFVAKKVRKKKEKPLPKPQKHLIHKAIVWKKMLDSGTVKSISDLSRKVEISRPRVIQIMNLLKLPSDVQEFLMRLDNSKDVRDFSEWKFRINPNETCNRVKRSFKKKRNNKII